MGLGGFQFLHFLSQGPEGAVDVGVLVDASDFTGAAAGYEAAGFVALDIAKATADEVFLHGVEGVPHGRGCVLMAAEGENLLGFDGCGFLGVVISGDQGGAGECLALAFGESEGGHFVYAFGNLGEPVEDADAAFDDLALDVSLVGDADVVDEVLSYDHSVATDEAENSGHEAI